ncbi:MAG: hypothetical protein U1E33_08680 [Rhodospirillales bacterium]
MIGAPAALGAARSARKLLSAALTATVLASSGQASGQDEASSAGGDQADLAAAAQNPVAAMISLPFQNNTFFRTGPDNDTANVLNIQPVIPFSLGDWNIITRTIIPLIYLPSVTDSLPELPSADTTGDDFGLGDINFTAYFSPVSTGSFTWGVGPSLTLRTATSDRLGTQKWSAGPAAVGLVTIRPWVAGALVRQLWSFAGKGDRSDVNQTLVQPFVNYNMAGGWYLVTSPVITVNWEADKDNAAMVPVGGGVGRVFTVGSQPVNAQVQGFYNAVRPDFAPQASLRLQLALLFPK